MQIEINRCPWKICKKKWIPQSYSSIIVQKVFEHWKFKILKQFWKLLKAAIESFHNQNPINSKKSYKFN